MSELIFFLKHGTDIFQFSDSSDPSESFFYIILFMFKQ